MGLIWQGTGFAFIWLVLSQFHLLGGWSLGEIAFLYGFRLIIHACSVLIFGLFQRVEDIVRNGDFDRFLVRPVTPFLQVITYKFSISSFGDLLGGLSIFLVASVMIHVRWHPFALIYLLLTLIGGCLVETAIKLAASAFTFRTLSSWQVVSFFENSMDIAASYPFTIYNTLTSFFFDVCASAGLYCVSPGDSAIGAFSRACYISAFCLPDAILRIDTLSARLCIV